jgi:phospholipid/cholesterol/gamma-HCH transport system substrate-binding protein
MRYSKPILFKVIAFAIVCGAFTVLLGVRLANVRLFASETAYEAEFSNAAGVVRGDAVKIAGVDVGRVTSTRIEDGRAVITFTVDDSAELKESTTAALRWRNVLGQRFLYVFPGDSGRLLEEGDRIPLAQTEPAGDIGDLLNNLGPILRAVDPAKANRLLDAVNTALIGNESTVRRLLDNGAALASDLGAMDDDIAGVVDSSDEILSVYAQQNAAIDSILGGLNSVGGELQKTTGDLNAVITDFAAVQKHLKDLLAENRDEIDATLADANEIAATLAANRRALGRTLCTLPVGIASYFQTSSWGEWFNVRIVEVLLRDQTNNTIARRAELPQQRGEAASSSYTDCTSVYERKGAAQPITDIGLIGEAGIETLVDLLLPEDGSG